MLSLYISQKICIGFMKTANFAKNFFKTFSKQKTFRKTRKQLLSDGIYDILIYTFLFFKECFP